MTDKQIQDLIDETNKPTEYNFQLKNYVEYTLWLSINRKRLPLCYDTLGEELWDKLRPQLVDWLSNILKRRLYYEWYSDSRTY